MGKGPAKANGHKEHKEHKEISGGLSRFVFYVLFVAKLGWGPTESAGEACRLPMFSFFPSFAARRFCRKSRVVKNINELCDQIRQCAYEIHVYHAHGHLEKVYENALVHRLRKAGLDVRQQHPIPVFDEDGTSIGDYYADLWVENCVVVELKASRALASDHEAQILGYLRAARAEHGLLINFGSFKFEIRKFRR